MSEQPNSTDNMLDEAISNPVDLTNNQVSYTNTVRFFINQYEVILDTYFLGPAIDLKKPQQALRLNRLVIPIQSAKRLAAALTEAIEQQEATK